MFAVTVFQTHGFDFFIHALGDFAHGKTGFHIGQHIATKFFQCAIQFRWHAAPAKAHRV